jgi:hypothetical protein
MKSASLKRVITNALALAAVLALVACASPRTATITDGSVTNITSAEAVTLAKQGIRSQKVADVQTNQKPIFKIEAHAGQVITINAKSIEVNVPMDIRELLAEQADAVSENVQLARIIKDGLKEVAVPMGLGAMLVSDRKNSSNNAARIEEARSAERGAQSQAMADIASEGMGYAAKPPLIVTTPAPTIVQVPLGSAVLGTTPE